MIRTPWGRLTLSERVRVRSASKRQGSYPVRRDGIHYAVEVLVTIAVKAHFLRLLLLAQRFECARPVQAAVGAVSGAEQPVRPACASAVALHFVPLVKVFLHVVLSN